MKRRKPQTDGLPRWTRWSYTSEWWPSRALHDAALVLAGDPQMFIVMQGVHRVSDALILVFGEEWDGRRGSLWPRGLELTWPMVPPDEPRGGEHPWPPPPGGPPAALVAAVEALADWNARMKVATSRGELVPPRPAVPDAARVL